MEMHFTKDQHVDSAVILPVHLLNGLIWESMSLEMNDKV